MVVVTGTMAAIPGGPAPHREVARTFAKGMRMVSLTRRSKETYGFHLKGGQQNNTGFFISHVEKGSVAEEGGVKAGDQVLEVCGRTVSGQVHRHVADRIALTATVTLLLRATGIVPVQKREGEPMVWMLTEQRGSTKDGGPPVDRLIRVIIPKAGGTTMGFSVNQSTEPGSSGGMVVATVRAGSPAGLAGLRVADHILSCNGIDLTGLDHQQAVGEMKKQSRLVLEVRRSCRPEAVLAGESSGYNSSASSTTGDQTPPTSKGGRTKRRPHPKMDHVSSRLSSVSHRLGREQELRTIDGEWANAEAAVKRRQLSGTAQKLNGARKGHPMSRSASDLLDPVQYESSDQSPVYLTSAINPTAGSALIRPAYSTTNLLNYQNSNHICTSDEESIANTVYSTGQQSTITTNTSICSSSNNKNKDRHSRHFDEQQYNSSSNSSNSSGCGNNCNNNNCKSTTSCNNINSSNCCNSNNGNHKIALVSTNSAPHVSNIVVAQYRDEKDALSRLDQLSGPDNGTTSRKPLLSTGRSSAAEGHQVPLDQVQLVEQELHRIQQQKRLLAEQEKQLVREKTRFERHLPSSSSSRSPSPNSHYRPPPSPTPSSTSSGVHTSRIHIKTNPPAPPKRHTTTTLTRRRGGEHHHRDNQYHHHQHQQQHSCCHNCHDNNTTRRKQQQQHHLSSSSLTLSRQKSVQGGECSHQHYHHCHHNSPPSSPSSSSGISCGSATQLNSLPRRCKSFDELSHSSNEDTAIWDNFPANYNNLHSNQSIYDDKCHYFNPKNKIPIPPVPKPPINANQRQHSNNSSTTTSKMNSSGPPVPPPQPSAPLIGNVTHADFASAISGAANKLKPKIDPCLSDKDVTQAFEARIDANKRRLADQPQSAAPADTKDFQHKMLMQEFKRKHKSMFKSDEPSARPESSITATQVMKGPEVITIPKSQLHTITYAVSKVSQPSNYISTEKSVQLSSQSSINDAPFTSKIITRSLSSGQKMAPIAKASATTVALTTVDETDTTESNSVMQYWKKKTDEPAILSTRPPPNKKPLTTTVSFINTTPSKRTASPARSDQQIKIRENSVTEVSEISQEKLSASDLIKSFNTSSSLTKSANTNNVYMNKGKSPKAKAPGVPEPTMVSSGNVNRTSRLVKTQSWSERHGRSIINISHSTHDTSHEDDSAVQYNARFNAPDNSASNFKAMFNSTQKSNKPLVSIDSYGSNSGRVTGQKANFMGVNGHDGGSTLTRNNIRQRYNPDEPALTSDSSSSDDES